MAQMTGRRRIWLWLLFASGILHAISWQLGFAGAWVAPYEKAIGWLALGSLAGIVAFGIGFIIASRR
jgi:hypothetical protein